MFAKKKKKKKKKKKPTGTVMIESFIETRKVIFFL